MTSSGLGNRYFKALAGGEIPPVKQRLEMPTSSSKKGGLTKGALAMLHTQVITWEHVVSDRVVAIVV